MTYLCDITGFEQDRIRLRLEDFYRKHFPEGIANIDQAFSMPVTEDEMFKRLTDKYCNNNNNNNPNSNTNAGAPSSSSAAAAAANTMTTTTSTPLNSNAAITQLSVCDYTGTERDRLRLRLKRHYEKHNPEGAEANIEKAMALKLTEEKIFKKVTEKYNTDPKVEEAESRALGLLPGMTPSEFSSLLMVGRATATTSGGADASKSELQLPPTTATASSSSTTPTSAQPQPTLINALSPPSSGNSSQGGWKTTTVTPSSFNTSSASGKPANPAAAVYSPPKAPEPCKKCLQLEAQNLTLDRQVKQATQMIAQLETDKQVLTEQLLEVKAAMVAVAQQMGFPLPQDLV